jgi:butyryl-CoA dehydrogenase
MLASRNPLVDDRLVDFVLYDVLDATALCCLPAFRDHGRETFDLFVRSCRKLARDVLFPVYRVMDESPPRFSDGRILCHPLMKELYPRLAQLGVLNATRPYDVGGQQLPNVVNAAASAYLGAANGAAVAHAGITAGAAHLIEAFGSDRLKQDYMAPMRQGRWTGTMALTEPHAGSGLMDLQTKATPTRDGHYLIQGSKVFISGGDNDFTENIVHLTLARIAGAPSGTRGISLFVVPKKRIESGKLVDNDVKATGTFHKLGWRALPSIALGFGENDDCHGYLVGEPHRGLPYMFQMMNESRLAVGSSAMATAMVAYHEALAYAKARPQGRRIGQSLDGNAVPIIEHADVRRMLLRQKAIVEGAFSLILSCAYSADLAEHAETPELRTHHQQLLDLLTPVAKTFPAERGFESNALAVQVHGGYGYTSEYLPEAWLRDQKLNTIHEGTTGIQSLDLLGRKVLATGGATLMALGVELERALERGRRVGLSSTWLDSLQRGAARLQDCTVQIASTAGHDVERALQNSVDYLDLLGTLVIGWQWLKLASVAKERSSGATASDEAATSFYGGKLRAAQYWFEHEMPRVPMLAEVIVRGDDAFLRASGDEL